MIRKLILFALLIVSISSEAQIKVGPEAGVYIGSISRSVQGFSVNNSVRPGLRAGLNADFAINDNFSIQPGLFYTGRSTKSTLDFFVISIEQSLSVNYLELPVNFVYKAGSPDKGRIFIGVGPYIGYALGGKTKTDIPNSLFLQGFINDPSLLGLLTEDRNINVGVDTTDDVRPIDIGANISIGYEFPFGLFFRGQVGMGFMNTAPLDEFVTQQNWGSAITIGYLFNTARKEAAIE